MVYGNKDSRYKPHKTARKRSCSLLACGWSLDGTSSGQQQMLVAILVLSRGVFEVSIQAGMKIRVYPDTVAWNVQPIDTGPKILMVLSVSDVRDHEVPPYCRNQIQGKILFCVHTVAENGYPFTIFVFDTSKIEDMR